MAKEQLKRTVVKRLCSRINKDLEVELKNMSNNNEAYDADVAIWNVQVYI